MALGFSILGLGVAAASSIVAAAMGASVFEIIAAYVGCGTAVLFAALVSAAIFDSDSVLSEDPILIRPK